MSGLGKAFVDIKVVINRADRILYYIYIYIRYYNKLSTKAFPQPDVSPCSTCTHTNRHNFLGKIWDTPVVKLHKKRVCVMRHINGKFHCIYVCIAYL